MKILATLFALVAPSVAFACNPVQSYAQSYAPVQMPFASYQSYSTGFAQYSVPMAQPSVFLQQPPSFTIINNNNNNNSGGRSLRSSVMGVSPAFVPTAGTQVNFIGRRAFRFGPRVIVNP